MMNFQRLFLYVICISICLSRQVLAQVSDYTFATSTQTYAHFADGDVMASDTTCVDNELFTVALPFSFTYCNVSYDTISVSANGYLTFGAGTTHVESDVIDSLTNTIAAFAGDLYACDDNHDLSYVTLGYAPNRIFIVQWSNWGLQGSGLSELNVQIRLFEGSNLIQLMYGACSGATPSNITVGISGNDLSDFQTRTTTSDWLATTTGTSTSTCTYSSSVLPANGLTFQWDADLVAEDMEFTSFMGWYMNIQAGQRTRLTTATGCYDDQAFAPVLLPFTFSYHNVPINSIGVHANGYIKMGATAPTVYTSVLSTEPDIIAIMANDLYGCAANRDISYGVVGDAPNRTFIIQWTNWGFYNLGFSEFSAQIQLHEQDQSIDFVYGPGFPYSYKNISVGLSGNSVSDFHVRKTAFNWFATTKANNNTATCSFTPFVFPWSGLTYTFSPPVGCSDAPFAGTTTADSTAVCPGSDVTLHLSGAEADPDISYQWQVASHPDSSYINISGANDSTYVHQADSAAYFRCSLTCITSGLSSVSTAVGVSLLPMPEVAISGILDTTLCAGSDVLLSITTDLGNTIQWLRYGNTIAGANTDTYTADASGIYTVSVSDGVCVQLSEPMYVSVYTIPELVDVTASPDSICAGNPVTLTATAAPVQTAIFTESWEDADYIAAGWTSQDGCDNWSGWTSYTPSGSSAPTAYFNWATPLVNYSCSMISPVIDATGNTDVYLNYKLLLDNYSSATDEYFTIEYKSLDDVTWTTLEVFQNTIGAAVQSYDRVDQSLAGMGGTRFQIRLTASGENSFSINGWGIDDILVTGSNTYTYSWYAEPAGFTASGITAELIEPTPGNYVYFVEVENTATGCASVSASDTVTFTNSNTYYADADGDGYGDPAGVLFSCIMPVGYVTNDDDCNDLAAASFPGNPEVCDGLDNDCDGFIDNFITANVTPIGPISLCNGASQVLTCTTGPGYTYRWKKNGVNISGATNSSYTVTKAGTYSCVVTVGVTCSVTSNSVVVSVNPLPSATISNQDIVNNLCIDPSIKLKANSGTGFTYQWIRNGTAIAGATNLVYYATTVGSYRVTVTNTFGCSKTSTIYTIINVCRDANETPISEASIQLYPNPTDGRVQIDFNTGGNYSGNAQCTCFDLQGRYIADMSMDVIDGSGYYTFTLPESCASGLYLLRILTPDGTQNAWVELVR